MKNDLI
jgi:hypothetical protein